jgi:hypothetical protein
MTPRKLLLMMNQHLKYTQIANGIEPDESKHDEQAFEDLLKM